MNEAAGEISQSPGEKIIKEDAIDRHYNTATSPTASLEDKRKAGHALKVLGLDRGKGIIINILDELKRKIPKEKNKIKI